MVVKNTPLGAWYVDLLTLPVQIRAGDLDLNQPLFAFMNAGVSLEYLNPSRLINMVPIGIALGLLIGKPLGVMTFAWRVIRLQLVTLRESINLQ